MIETSTNLTMQDYLAIGLRRKWYIITVFLLTMAVTTVLCIVLPDIFKATTTILIIPQEVPDEFVKSTVTMKPSDYLNVITQEIMSRTHLEKVINDIYKPVNKESIEALLEKMRSNIEIKVNSSRDKGVSSFTISYLEGDPQYAAMGANSVASLFIRENLKNREVQAKKTTIFLKDELAKLNITLRKLEDEIAKFKQKNIGSLPEQRDSNLKMLDQLILQRQRVTDELNETKNRSIVFQKELFQSKDISLSPTHIEQNAAAVAPLQLRIKDAQRRLIELQNRYTDEHPDVVATKAELKNLIAQADDSPLPADDVGNITQTPIDRELLSFQLEIASLKKEDAMLREKIADYQQRVELAPKLEQALSGIMRDYQNTRNAYDLLMQKQLEAEQAEKLEINQKGEQFRVLDKALPPMKPDRPNRIKMLFIGFFLSLALGGGLAGFVEYIDQSFYTIKELESYTGINVLASIPVLASASNLQRK